MTNCQRQMLMTIFQANDYPKKEELHCHAKSLCISVSRLKSKLRHLRRRKKAEAVLPGSEFIKITLTHTHTYTHTHTCTIGWKHSNYGLISTCYTL